MKVDWGESYYDGGVDVTTSIEAATSAGNFIEDLRFNTYLTQGGPRYSFLGSAPRQESPRFSTRSIVIVTLGHQQ